MKKRRKKSEVFAKTPSVATGLFGRVSLVPERYFRAEDFVGQAPTRRVDSKGRVATA